MTDELDLLSSLNPIPEVRGNPGPVPSPGERGGRSRWALGAIGLAAAVAVVVGIVAATGDDPGRGDQLITSVDEPPAPVTDGGPVADPDEPPVAEDAAAPTDPVAEPTENLVVTDETIPWPDPIVIEVTPETASADRIIEIPAGLVVLEIRGSGWELGANVVFACESYEAHERGGFACRRAVQDTLGGARTFSDELVVPGWGPTTLLLSLNDPNGAAPLEVGTLVPVGDDAPRLMEPGVRASSLGTGVVDRVELEARVTGAGWAPEPPIVFHVCASRPIGSLDAGDCTAVAAATPAADGTVETTLTMPIELVGGAVEGSEFWLVGAQGSRLAAMRYMVLGPRVDPGPRPDSLPATVDVAIVDLRAGERAEVRTCGPSAACREPIRRVEVVGSGSGLDTVSVTIDENVDRVQLFVEGSIVADGIWFEEDPSPAGPDAQPAAITVEPGSVPGPGTYEFTVRGSGWSVEPPVFVLSCFAIPPVGAPVQDSCDVTDLTPVTPVDGAFEVTVTYDVGPDGLVIAAGNATQTQSAIAAIEVVE
jgi:hypothetical protein